MTSVHALQSTDARPGGSPLYFFVPCEPQPSMDVSVQILHRVLSPALSVRYGRFIKRRQGQIVTLYLVVLLLRALVVFVDAPLGRKLAPMAFVIQLPLATAFLFSLSHEFARLLTHVLDFWLHSLTIGVWVVCLAITFNDARMLILPGCWIDCINAVLVEASFHAGVPSMAISIVAASVLMALMAAVSLDLIQDVQYQAHATPRHSIVSIKDLMLNAMGTTFMLLVRIIYRKHLALRQERNVDTPGLHQSLSYRCRLKLQQRQIATFHVPAPGPVEKSLRVKAVRTSTMRRQPPRMNLCFVTIQTAIDPQHVLVPVVARMAMQMKRWHANLLHVIGLASLVLSALPFIAYVPQWVSIGALTTALAFVGWFLCCLHRDLLHQLVTSFDFVFLYLQLLAAHLCICKLIGWDWTRSCAIASGHLWMLWALTLDALTPGLRHRLRLNMSMATAIVFICAFANALLSIELLCWTHWQIQDSQLVDVSALGRRLQFHVQSFLLSRFLTILAWCSRLLWRLCTRRDESELVMLLGRVEYNYREWKTQSRNWSLLSTGSVAVNDAGGAVMVRSAQTASFGLNASLPIHH